MFMAMLIDKGFVRFFFIGADYVYSMAALLSTLLQSVKALVFLLTLRKIIWSWSIVQSAIVAVEIEFFREEMVT